MFVVGNSKNKSEKLVEISPQEEVKVPLVQEYKGDPTVLCTCSTPVIWDPNSVVMNNRFANAFALANAHGHICRSILGNRIVYQHT